MKLLAPILFVTLLGGTALADAVPGPPPCPKGHEGHSDHGGGYCQPPPPKCPKGETPRATRGDWYCEPPPPKDGCPPGSVWTSRSREDTWCDGQRSSCERGSKDPQCIKNALCVKEITREYHGRVQGTYIEERAISVCTKGKACAEGYKCVTAPRYHEPPPPKPDNPPGKTPGKGALLLLPLFALALAVGAAFRRRR
jgi:hypothetical protein